jgi:hypothetical protein
LNNQLRQKCIERLAKYVVMAVSTGWTDASDSERRTATLLATMAFDGAFLDVLDDNADEWEDAAHMPSGMAGPFVAVLRNGRTDDA